MIPVRGELRRTPAQKNVEAPDPVLPEVKVTITGNDQMKYDVTSIEAKPGQKVTVTLKNGGIIPKVSMGHNFVLLAQDVDLAKFVEAGIPHMGKVGRVAHGQSARRLPHPGALHDGANPR